MPVVPFRDQGRSIRAFQRQRSICAIINQGTYRVDLRAKSREPAISVPRASAVSVGSSQAQTVYLYEDDHALASEIVLAFAAEAQTVEIIADEVSLLSPLKRSGSVLILDRMIGGRDSLATLQTMRGAGHRMPVLVISSLSSVDDRIYGLKTGGDDYLVKPFAMGELIARVAALRRRASDGMQTSFKVGTLTMDLIARTVQRNGRSIPLLPREFSLLEYLMRHAGQIVTRAMLLEDVWHYRQSTQTNVVDVHIGNLRRKLQVEGESRLIASVRGVGFKMSDEDIGE